MPRRSARSTRARAMAKSGSSLPRAEGARRFDGLGEVGGGAGDGQGALDAEVGRGREGLGGRRALFQEGCARRRAGRLRKGKPAAMAWPPPVSSRPAWRAAMTAAPRSTPGTGRPEPLARPSAMPADAGGAVELLFHPAGDDADDAGVPAVAGDQQHGAAGAAWASAAAKAAAMTSPRPPGGAGSRRRAARPWRGPRSGLPPAAGGGRDQGRRCGPPALMRGPRVKPRCMGA